LGTRISIDELKPHTYVVRIIDGPESLKVQKPGWVRTGDMVQHLRRLGVKHLEIDPHRTWDEATENEMGAGDLSTDEGSSPPADRVVPVEEELSRAHKLYEEARAFQAKAFEKVAKGQALDIEPVQEITQGMIDSVFRNPDAMLALTRMRIKDQYLLEHSTNVSILMTVFANFLRLDKELIATLAQGAFLHDIGKILIPDHILHKPGKLTDEEYEIMKSHAQHSADIVASIDGMDPLACQVVARHHERLDGKGYPGGLSEVDLSQYDRMIAIVDVYDALTADRVYKEGMVPIRALGLMNKLAGAHFDRELLRRFISCMGVHPVGTLVKLTSGRLGMVLESNRLEPLKPKVKVFYNIRTRVHMEPKMLDLAAPGCNDSIESAVKPEEFKLDLLRFFRETML
jgi:putative nucleotidyltransferase with HDIG domain